MSFGDTEPGDAVDAAAPDADPYQVAVRLHEARVKLLDATGETLPHWHELDPDERELAVAVVLAVVAILRAEGTRL